MPDKRLADEEIILRYFAFRTLGIKSYRTPQKHWLTDAAKNGRRFSDIKISELHDSWNHSLDVVLILFDAKRAFRRPNSTSINRALFDLLMTSASALSAARAKQRKSEFLAAFDKLLKQEEFSDLISRSVDHKKRTERRFELWNERMDKVF